MPPRWPRQPDRRDPAFRRLDDRMTFATHVAAFAACNSGLWFFHFLDRVPEMGGLALPLPWITGGWLAGLVAHGLYIFAIADYSESADSPAAALKSPKR